MEWNYETAVAYLLDIPKFAGKTSLDNLRVYLKILGNPHLAIPSVHVAGTNGKGSTCAFLSSILQQAGCKVGLFTSPHLIRMNERFQINRTCISDEDFLEQFQKVKNAVDQGMQEGSIHPNFFEFAFLMAVCWYQQEQADIVIFETGLGGRLDATNVLQPCLTVLTSIGMDHMQYLGDTLEQIAWEKAGILKPDVPCVYIRQQDVSGTVIEKRGKELGILMIPVEKSNISIDKIGEQTIDFSYRNRYDIEYNLGQCTYRIEKTALYQLENAAIAVEAGYFICHGWKTGEFHMCRTGISSDKKLGSVIHQGISDMHWQGRMEEIEPGIYVDGAHNEPAIQAFCRTITRMYQDKKIILLFAVASDKQYNKMIQILCRENSYEQIIVTAISGGRTTPVEQVAEEFRKYTDCPIYMEPDSIQALTLAKRLRRPDERVFCVGSLYLVGSMEQNKEENQ